MQLAMIRCGMDNYPHNYIEVTLMDGTFYRIENVQKVFLSDRMPFGEKADFEKEKPAYGEALQCNAITESDCEEFPIGTWFLVFKRIDLLEKPKEYKPLDPLRRGGQRAMSA